MNRHNNRFHITVATAKSIGVIDAILQQTSAEINDPALFMADGREYVSRHIEKDGFVLLAYSDTIVAGFLLVDFPGDQEHNLALDLGWDKTTLSRCAHMDIACVLPEFRGMGLQKILLREAECTLASMGYTYALATVYPENKPSLQNLLASGYVIGATKPKYGGVLRHVVWKIP